MEGIPRPEYPRPQFARSTWLNLNGVWSYTFDHGRSGHDRRLFMSRGFDSPITVPFCPESRLSGVAYTEFIEAMWYHRAFTVPADWKGNRVVLHFGAVDYQCEVFIDGVFIERHVGGSSPFGIDITKKVRFGETHDLVVYACDDVRSGEQPSGKQSVRFASQGCHYTRVTGIWQTVWLEPVAAGSLQSSRFVTDIDGERLIIIPRFLGIGAGMRLTARVTDAGGAVVAEMSCTAAQQAPLVLDMKGARLWSPSEPNLYRLTLTTTDIRGATIDTVESYAGMRKIHYEGNRLLLNNEPVYLRFVLDQGFYPEGVWTAPSDSDLRGDIELSMNAGFNGARLHQKAFEERFHYWADTLGYLTWAESPSWGLDVEKAAAARNFMNEWASLVCRDRNHPSVIAWTPFNEVKKSAESASYRRLLGDTYELTHELDGTRPVNDCSGWVHVKTDLFTVHNYEQDPARLSEQLRVNDGTPFVNFAEISCPYEGQPYFVDEFGGTKLESASASDPSAAGWGYGNTATTADAYVDRLRGLVDAILGHDHIQGYCFTQLTDVEQEQNGVYTYDREEKVAIDRIAEVFSRDPAHMGGGDRPNGPAPRRPRQSPPPPPTA